MSIFFAIISIVFAIVAILSIPFLAMIGIGFLIVVYSIPFYIYCSFKLSDKEYALMSKRNFFVKGFYATKCYFYLLTFRKPKFKFE